MLYNRRRRGFYFARPKVLVWSNDVQHEQAGHLVHRLHQITVGELQSNRGKDDAKKTSVYAPKYAMGHRYTVCNVSLCAIGCLVLDHRWRISLSMVTDECVHETQGREDKKVWEADFARTKAECFLTVHRRTNIGNAAIKRWTLKSAQKYLRALEAPGYSNESIRARELHVDTATQQAASASADTERKRRNEIF